MASHASSVATVHQETGPEQLPAGSGPAAAEPSTVTGDDRPRPLEVTHCSLCGATFPLGLLVPDGGQACTDIRWYCKDAVSCTNRWTTAARSPEREHGPADPDDAFAGAG
jgi:hypothetical protein